MYIFILILPLYFLSGRHMHFVWIWHGIIFKIVFNFLSTSLKLSLCAVTASWYEYRKYFVSFFFFGQFRTTYLEYIHTLIPLYFMYLCKTAAKGDRGLVTIPWMLTGIVYHFSKPHSKKILLFSYSYMSKFDAQSNLPHGKFRK